MEKHLRQKLKAHIQAEIKAVADDITAFARLTQPISPDNAIGRLTRMEAINSKSINEAALVKAQNTLAKLERALARCEHPDFGRCSECDEPIPVARLMILPETDLCVQCAASLQG